MRTSGGGAGGAVLDDVTGEPALVVATVGAEPIARGGYAAALLLDGSALLARADLRAGEEALRRWMAAAALVRPAQEGGVVVAIADAGAPVVQALVRWDPVTASARELADRQQLGFPPAARVASVSGTPPAVEDLLELTRLPPGAQVLGPVPMEGPSRAGDGADAQGDHHVRAFVRVPRPAGAALAAALRAAAGVRTARKAPDPVRVRIDPVPLG